MQTHKPMPAQIVKTFQKVVLIVDDKLLDVDDLQLFKKLKSMTSVSQKYESKREGMIEIIKIV